MPNDNIGLPRLLPELVADGYELPAGVNARLVYNLVVNGRLPAKQINGRYFFEPKDKPSIAKLLGIAPPRAKPGRKPSAVADQVAA